MQISGLTYDVIKCRSLRGYLEIFGAEDLIFPQYILPAHVFS